MAGADLIGGGIGRNNVLIVRAIIGAFTWPSYGVLLGLPNGIVKGAIKGAYKGQSVGN